MSGLRSTASSTDLRIVGARSRRWLKRLALTVIGVVLAFVSVARPLEVVPLEESSSYRATMEEIDRKLELLRETSEGVELEAGVSRVEIDPPGEWRVPMGGNRKLFFSRAEGVSSESVWARALALRQGETRFLLISADVMVIYPLLAQRVLGEVRREIPLESEELMLVAAHTHSGPGGYWEGALAEMSVGPFDQRILDFLVERMSQVAIDAWRRLEPVEVSVGGVELRMPIKNRARLYGPENTELFVLRLTAEESGRSADLVSFSAHPTNVLKGNRMLSGDYPAVMAELIDDDQRTLIFAPGSIGDSKSNFRPIRVGRDRADAVGRYLVEQGLDVVTLDAVQNPVLESFEVAVTMPRLQPRVLRTDRFGSWVARPWLTNRLMPAHMEETVIQVVRIGNVILFGAPADLAGTVALPLMRRAEDLGLKVLFVSMADDWIGYVLRDSEYRDLDYKETTQFHGPHSGTLFEAAYSRLIDGLAARRAAVPPESGSSAISSSSSSIQPSAPR